MIGRRPIGSPAERARAGSSAGTSGPPRYIPNSSATTPAAPARSDAVTVISCGDLGEQLLRRAAVEIAHDAVVVEDRHLVVGKDHATGNSRANPRPLPRAARDASGRRRAVVAVGDVDRGQRLERRGELVDRGAPRRSPRARGVTPSSAVTSTSGSRSAARSPGSRRSPARADRPSSPDRSGH